MRACVVILGAISHAQVILPMPYEDYKQILAIHDRMYPINLVIISLKLLILRLSTLMPV
jgi:hypothetical protein